MRNWPSADILLICWNRYRCPKVDCNGTLDGGLEFDACRVCDGDNSTCTGCDDVPVLDPSARKYLDRCGICDGDGQSCLGCDGAPNSGLLFDSCGVCGGDNSTCMGCDNVPNSDKIEDACGVCGGDGVCRRSIAVVEPLTFAEGVSTVAIQASVAAMFAVPISEIKIEITSIVQKVEQSLNLAGTIEDFDSDASRDVLRQGLMTMLESHREEAETEETTTIGTLEDVTILVVRHTGGRRRLKQEYAHQQGRRNGEVVTAGKTIAALSLSSTWKTPPPRIAIRFLQEQRNPDTDADTVWIDYSVSASRDVSELFLPEVFIPSFVAAVNALNSSAVPRLNGETCTAEPPTVQTNVSFVVQMPAARADALDEAADLLSTDPQSLATVASAGPCSVTPCQNGGQCHGDIDRGFRCECVGEWSGELCEIEPPLPPPPRAVLAAGSVVATLSLEGELLELAGEEGSTARQVFLQRFRMDISRALEGVEPSQVIVLSVVPGSVVVEFAVTPSADGTVVEPAAIQAAFGTIVFLQALGVITTNSVSGIAVPVPAVEDHDVGVTMPAAELQIEIVIGAASGAVLLLVPLLLAVCIWCRRRTAARESNVSVLRCWPVPRWW